MPVDQWVLDHLAAHIHQHGLGADGVLLHRDGVPFDSAKFGYELRTARRRAGLPESITFHDLRHFFASALIHAGCSVKQVLSTQAAFIRSYESTRLALAIGDKLRDAREAARLSQRDLAARADSPLDRSRSGWNYLRPRSVARLGTVDRNSAHTS